MKKITCKFRNASGLLNNIILLVFSTCLMYPTLYAQERKMIYDVLRNGNIIGKIIFLELNIDQKKFLSFNSDIKTNFILSFSDQTTEKSIFENEIMVYSSLYQKQTGSNKTNSIIQASGNMYKFINGGISKTIYGYPIYYNTLLLYVKPPENIYKVYSQKFKKLLDIKKMEENKYRLSLPDGNYNYYIYKNGLCSRVDIERTFFNVQFVLRESNKINSQN